MAHLVVVMLVSVFATVAHSMRDYHDAMLSREPIEVKRVLPDIHRPRSDLYMDVHIEIIPNRSGVYEALLKSMVEKRAHRDGETVRAGQTLSDLRAKQIEYVQGLYGSLLCDPPAAAHAPADAPAAFFVLGGMAVGKSTFIGEFMFPRRTVHVNHDDIRSLLAGNYEVFAETKRIAGEDRQMLIDDAVTVRSWVEQQVIERKCNFLRDSFGVDAHDVEIFVKNGYAAKVYYLEIGFKGSRFEGTDRHGSVHEYFAKKARLTQERIQGRVDSGGHGTSKGIAHDAIGILRGRAEELAKQLSTWNPPVPVNFYLSQQGRCDHLGSLVELFQYRPSLVGGH